jgi:hypothetical protein
LRNIFAAQHSLIPHYGINLSNDEMNGKPDALAA